MRRTIRAAGAILVLLLIGAGLRVYAQNAGVTPDPGFRLIDGTWLNGLAGGVNRTSQSGITAAGTTQATATALAGQKQLISVDTVAASTGVNLPSCFAGTLIMLYNNGANTLTVYPAVANNSVTAAQDTINNGTSTTQTTHTSKIYFCAKNGVWAAQ